MNNLRWITIYCTNFNFVFFACISHEFLYVFFNGSVGIATRYELDGPRVETRWRRVFPHSSRPAMGPIQPPVQCVRNLFLVSKATETWLWLSTSSSVKVKERVQLYIYSSSRSSWPFLGWNLTCLLFASQFLASISLQYRTNRPIIYRYQLFGNFSSNTLSVCCV
jgi:hypothetical protein